MTEVTEKVYLSYRRDRRLGLVEITTDDDKFVVKESLFSHLARMKWYYPEDDIGELAMPVRKFGTLDRGREW